MNGKRPYMDYPQHRAARRLVHECCNYDNGNCIVLDGGRLCMCAEYQLFASLPLVYLCRTSP